MFVFVWLVGLHLTFPSGRVFQAPWVIGFDIDTDRIQDLGNGVDKTGEVSSEVLGDAKGLTFTSDTSEIAEANTYIITVPTPVDKFRVPDLKPLEYQLDDNPLFVSWRLSYLQSTVYPGNPWVCGTILENKTGFKLVKTFT